MHSIRVQSNKQIESITCVIGFFFENSIKFYAHFNATCIIFYLVHEVVKKIGGTRRIYAYAHFGTFLACIRVEDREVKQWLMLQRIS